MPWGMALNARCDAGRRYVYRYLCGVLCLRNQSDPHPAGLCRGGDAGEQRLCCLRWQRGAVRAFIPQGMVTAICFVLLFVLGVARLCDSSIKR